MGSNVFELFLKCFKKIQYSRTKLNSGSPILEPKFTFHQTTHWESNLWNTKNTIPLPQGMVLFFISHISDFFRPHFFRPHFSVHIFFGKTFQKKFKKISKNFKKIFKKWHFCITNTMGILPPILPPAPMFFF